MAEVNAMTAQFPRLRARPGTGPRPRRCGHLSAASNPASQAILDCLEASSPPPHARRPDRAQAAPAMTPAGLRASANTSSSSGSSPHAYTIQAACGSSDPRAAGRLTAWPSGPGTGTARRHRHRGRRRRNLLDRCCCAVLHPGWWSEQYGEPGADRVIVFGTVHPGAHSCCAGLGGIILIVVSLLSHQWGYTRWAGTSPPVTH